MHTRQQLSGSYQIGCEFDNFKIWDLSGVDFSAKTTTTEPTTFESILTSITDKAPDYEDYFSNLDSGWPTDRNSTGNEYGYQDGETYIISAKNGCYSPGVPINRVFSDFVLETDIRFINQDEGVMTIGFRGNDSAHYGANISPLGWVYFYKNINGVHIPLLETEVPKSSFQAWGTPKHLTLVTRQNRMASSASACSWPVFRVPLAKLSSTRISR